MDMKTCTFLTLGLMISTGSGFSIDRPAVTTDSLQPPPLTDYPSRTAPLPVSKPVRLGVVPGTVPAPLVAQLELSGFPGVLATRIIPDSPAAKAGLKENDVIVKLGDMSLSGPQSITEALAGKVPGDKITAIFYRNGKRETADLTLDAGTLSAEEILAAQGDPRTQTRISPFSPRRTPPGGFSARPALPQGLLGAHPGAAMDRMQQIMDEFLRDSVIDDSRMDDVFNRMNLTPGAAQVLRNLQQLQQMPMPSMGNVPGGDANISSVHMSDNNGSIVISSNSQTGTTVRVTDAAGKVLYSGPYNTQEEKDAVPEAVRERLKNIETNFCF